jgi:hypothetical protein
MKLVIDLDEETQKISAQCVDAPRIDDMLTILFSVQLNFMNQFMKHIQDNADITPDQLQALKEDLYDKYNAGASNVLYLFAPDIEMHPDLTVEAMKEAEDRYMYNQLNRSQRREVDKKTHNQTKILRFPKVPHADNT